MPIPRHVLGTLAVLIGLMPFASAEQPPIGLELVDVKKIWDKAPHNAFTDLTRFNDQWYLAFREGTSHGVAGNGDVRVIRSPDGTHWKSVALLDYGTGWDMRDAKLNVMADGRLMLNTAAAPLANIRSRQSLVWFSHDGTDWSDGPHKVGEHDWWLWGVRVHPSGIVYGVGYGDLGNRPVTTRLYRSRNGIDYETLVPTLTPEPTSGETALVFRKDGSAVALVRTAHDERSLAGVARGDYTKWTFKATKKRLGGPELIELPDGNILAATRLYLGGTRTSLCWLDLEAGQLTELLRLPSGGDTSYPGLIWHDGLLWVSYYSSHEGRASIYLAKVRVKSADKISPTK
ncbi:MAG: exo-alpha-sialidase [Pirellulales bacterium]|nr:exo-alpha-sialidase [Pirellulales bacterium]